MKTVALLLPESFGQSYFERYQNYPERVRELEDQINESVSKFKKRLKKARLIDKSKELVFQLKEIEKEMVNKKCTDGSIWKIKQAISILKQITK